MTKQMDYSSLAHHAGSVEINHLAAEGRGPLRTQVTTMGGGLVAALLPFSTLMWIFVAR